MPPLSPPLCVYVCIPKYINTACSVHLVLLGCLWSQEQPFCIVYQLRGSSLVEAVLCLRVGQVRVLPFVLACWCPIYSDHIVEVSWVKHPCLRETQSHRRSPDSLATTDSPSIPSSVPHNVLWAIGTGLVLDKYPLGLGIPQALTCSLTCWPVAVFCNSIVCGKERQLWWVMIHLPVDVRLSSLNVFGITQV